MITNGSVTVEDGKKANEEYAPARKVSVTLAFAVPAEVTESAQAKVYLDTAASIADAKVNELLGRAAPTASSVQVTPKKTAAKKTEASKVEEPKERTKADLEAEMVAEVEAVSGKPATVPVDDGNDLTDLLGDSAPAPITDKELSDACIAKANKMKSVAGWEAKRIRTLMEEFTGAPGRRVVEIAVEKRREFLDKLEALK